MVQPKINLLKFFSFEIYFEALEVQQNSFVTMSTAPTYLPRKVQVSI